MNLYRNLKIGTKMIIGFLIVALIAGGIGLIGIFNINKIAESDMYLYTNMTEPLGNMILIAESFQRMRGNLKDIILSETEAEVADYESRIAERNVEFEENLALFEKSLFSDEGKKLTTAVFNNKAKYDEITAQVITYAKAGQKDLALKLMNSEGEEIRKLLEADYRTLKDLKVKFALEAANSNASEASSSTTTMIILLVVAMIISMLLGYFISSSIRKPISKIVASAEKIADGDLNVELDIQSKDEIGILAATFMRMTNNVNEVLTNINSASEQVSAGSRQVSDSSMALAQGATEQASAVEELTASVEEIASQTRLNSENASQANVLAESAKTSATLGNNQMKLMLNSMSDINDSSNNISKIIKVIDEIAFQTNILALNAAVEAARAGQHGKGFAVVAEEVRNLAARSANAAKETTDLIEGSISKVEGGTKIANETAHALEQIVTSVEKVSTLVGDIAVASKEQAIGVEQINQGIMQIADVVQTTSATSEETASASEELSGQAELLKEQVLRFKLKRNFQSTYRGHDEINPDVLRLLDSMRDQKNTNNLNKNQEKPKKIVLNDRDFGKY